MVTPFGVQKLHFVLLAVHGLHPWLPLGRPSGTIRALKRDSAKSRAKESAELRA